VFNKTGLALFAKPVENQIEKWIAA